MREIKFRAWHKKKKYYASVLAIDFETEHVVIGEHGCLDTQHILSFDEVVLEPFIGRRDSNGTKIYKGDIIAASKPYEVNEQQEILLDFIINGEKKYFEIVYNKHFAAFHKKLILPLEERSYREYETIIFDGDVVIGNIHENKELLK